MRRNEAGYLWRVFFYLFVKVLLLFCFFVKMENCYCLVFCYFYTPNQIIFSATKTQRNRKKAKNQSFYRFSRIFVIYSEGETPSYFLNALKKEVRELNPHSSPNSETEISKFLFSSNSFAYSTRSLLT